MRRVLWLMAALAAPASAQNAAISLSCEIERIITVSDYGRQPLKRTRIKLWDLSVDPQSRSVAISDVDDNGRRRTLVWPASVITPTTLVFCTYNIKCGEALNQPNGQFVDSLLVMPTTIDLRRNTLNRTLKITKSRANQTTSVRLEEDYGECRRT